MRILAMASLLAISAPIMAAAADTVEIAVLDRAVGKGELLSADDFTVAEKTAAQSRGALRVRDLAGMETARRLEPGAAVRSSDIVRQQLIRRGETVTIALRDRALSITAPGRALAGGALGDTVRVVTLSTSRTLTGTVEAAGVVRVGSN